MDNRVLIAEPNAELCQVYRTYFNRFGYEVRTVPSGLECVAELQQLLPAVLVLNWELPWGGADGVLQWLREQPSSMIPVIVTCDSLIEDTAAPIVATRRKPVSLDSLRLAIIDHGGVRPLSDVIGEGHEHRAMANDAHPLNLIG